MADIFSIIADSTRRQLLSVLLEKASDPVLDHDGVPGRGEHSVSELVARLELSQPTVSKHLKVLRDAGLVEVRDEGQHRFYRLNAGPLTDVEDWVEPFLGRSAVKQTAHAVLDIVGDFGSNAGEVADDIFRSGSALGKKVGRGIADSAHRARAFAERLGARGA